MFINAPFFEYNFLNINNWFILLLYYLIYTIIHEIIHAISYIINGAKSNKITFGIMLEKGILYCLCKQNINRRNILISLMSPLILIGIITYIISIIYKSPLLMLLSILNISGCVGDIVTFLFLRKIKKFEFTEIDDPTMFAVYSNKDVSKISHFGLKFAGKQDTLKRGEFKKIEVSAVSIMLIVFLIIMALN